MATSYQLAGDGWQWRQILKLFLDIPEEQQPDTIMAQHQLQLSGL